MSAQMSIIAASLAGYDLDAAALGSFSDIVRGRAERLLRD